MAEEKNQKIVQIKNCGECPHRCASTVSEYGACGHPDGPKGEGKGTLGWGEVMWENTFLKGCPLQDAVRLCGICGRETVQSHICPNRPHGTYFAGLQSGEIKQDSLTQEEEEALKKDWFEEVREGLQQDDEFEGE